MVQFQVCLISMPGKVNSVALAFILQIDELLCSELMLEAQKWCDLLEYWHLLYGFFWCAEVGNNQDPNGFLVALEHFEVDLPGGSTCDRWLPASWNMNWKASMHSRPGGPQGMVEDYELQGFEEANANSRDMTAN